MSCTYVCTHRVAIDGEGGLCFSIACELQLSVSSLCHCYGCRLYPYPTAWHTPVTQIYLTVTPPSSACGSFGGVATQSSQACSIHGWCLKFIYVAVLCSFVAHYHHGLLSPFVVLWMHQFTNQLMNTPNSKPSQLGTKAWTKVNIGSTYACWPI